MIQQAQAKSRIGLICADSPINETDPLGLAGGKTLYDPTHWKPGVNTIDPILAPYVVGTLGVIIAAPVVAAYGTSDFILYEIGQKTLTDANYAIYSQILNPVERGAAIVEDMGWIWALLPEGSGWWLGIGKTFGTGPTPGGWAAVAGLAALLAALGIEFTAQDQLQLNNFPAWGPSSCMDSMPSAFSATLTLRTSPPPGPYGGGD